MFVGSAVQLSVRRNISGEESEESEGLQDELELGLEDCPPQPQPQHCPVRRGL